MRYHFSLEGICARSVDFEIKDGAVFKVVFEGGCPGNLLGLSTLVEGRDGRELIRLLSGLRCGKKATSCPDQLARLLAHCLDESAPDEEAAGLSPGPGPRRPKKNAPPGR